MKLIMGKDFTLPVVPESTTLVLVASDPPTRQGGYSGPSGRYVALCRPVQE